MESQGEENETTTGPRVEPRGNAGSEEREDLKVCFCADLHGNVLHYQRLLQFAFEEENCDALLLGGDLMPKRMSSPAKQLSYFTDNILPLFLRHKKKPQQHLYLILGNADAITNLDALRELSSQHGACFQLLHSQVVPLCGSARWRLLGYSHIPFSPHRRKDWEKADFSEAPFTGFRRRRAEYRLEGCYVSKGEDVQFNVNIDLAEHCQQTSIYNDLEAILRAEEEQRQNDKDGDIYANHIWMVHTPPFDTALDILKTGEHVGSEALLHFIQQKQPLLTLHGHIHETVSMSNGQFSQRIGERTLSISVGHEYHRPEVRCILFHTGKVGEAQRVSLPVNNGNEKRQKKDE
ncbi:Metallophos domain-containing protein [Balamuthia mandrillaris]